MSIEHKLNMLMENRDDALEAELMEAVKKKMKEEDDKKGGDVTVDPVAAAAGSGEKEEVEDAPEVTNENPIDPEYSDEKEEEKEQQMKESAIDHEAEFWNYHDKMEAAIESGDNKKAKDMEELANIHARKHNEKTGKKIYYPGYDGNTPQYYTSKKGMSEEFSCDEKEEDEEQEMKESSAEYDEGEDKIKHLKEKDGNFSVKPSGDKFVISHTYYNNKHISDMINQKKTVKESVTELLGGEELSEDFKLKAATIFEAAVNNKFYELKESLEADYSAKEQALTEEFEAKAKTLEEQTAKQLEEAVAEIEKTLSDKIDGYFDIWSEQWISDNELALESGIKAELVESFIDGMKTVFEEHYVDIPETKIDVIQEMETKIEKLEKSLSESVDMFREVKQRADAVTREKIIEESAKSMTDLDASRFKRLVEDIEYDTEQTFTKKVSIIKESFFRVKEERKHEDTKEQIVESKPLLEEKVIPTENDPMSAYIKALKGSKA